MGNQSNIRLLMSLFSRVGHSRSPQVTAACLLGSLLIHDSGANSHFLISGCVCKQ